MTSPYAIKTNQEWKIVEDTQGYFTINNAYTRAYLHNSVEAYGLGEYTINYPKNNYINQKWQIIPHIIIEKNSNNINSNIADIKIYPNPMEEFLNIESLSNLLNTKMSILDLQGRVVLISKLNNNLSQHYVGDLKKGLYIVKLENNSGIYYVEKFVKK